MKAMLHFMALVLMLALPACALDEPALWSIEPTVRLAGISGAFGGLIALGRSRRRKREPGELSREDE